MRIDGLPEGLAGSVCYNAVNRLVGERYALCTGPEIVMPARTQNHRTHLAKIVFQEWRYSLRKRNFKRSAGLGLGPVENYPPFLAHLLQMDTDPDQRERMPAYRPE